MMLLFGISFIGSGLSLLQTGSGAVDLISCLLGISIGGLLVMGGLACFDHVTAAYDALGAGNKKIVVYVISGLTGLFVVATMMTPTQLSYCFWLLFLSLIAGYIEDKFAK
jgi:hypothetical protein